MSNSKLPNGGYSLTNGSNYMLDGFHFDTEYNNGVLDKARLPEAKGLASLPSGMIGLDSPLNSDLPTGVEVDSQMDLSDLTKQATAQDITIVDHEWLASESVEDLSGMRSHEDVLLQFAEGKFEHPQVNQLKALEEAWGEGRTTGLDIVPNTHMEKVEIKKEDKVSLLPQDLINESMRKLAYGERVGDILKGLVQRGVEGKDLTKISNLLESEYGLHGRVYLKEKYFEGIFNGKYDEVINKRCATSMYIIPKSKDCAFDRCLGREVSHKINWTRVANELLPKLETYGVKIAGSSYKETVKRAFVDLMEGRVESVQGRDTYFHIQENQSDLISLDYARNQLKNAQEEEFFVPTQQMRHETKIEKRLSRIASQLVSNHFLDQEQVDAVVSSTEKSAQEKIDRLYEISLKPKQANTYQSYQNPNTEIRSSVEEMKTAQAKAHKKANRQKESQNRNKILGEIKRLIKANLISQKEIDQIISEHKDVDTRLSEIRKLALRESEIKRPTQTAHYMSSKKASQKSESVDRVENWMRQKMSEGVAGEELTLLMQSRFASHVLEENQDLISNLRKAHEGLSGHVYVDTHAYLKEGCDKGSMRHRSNQIPTLLKNAKCGTCVFNSNGTCQKYNKPLIRSASEVVENVNKHQQENIRLANCSDSEKTASLFVNNYDPSEFALSQEKLVLDETPSNETLEGVLFGGFEI